MEKRKISARIVADSINVEGDRITSFILTYPRFIHAELMTHRVFSRNSASSRAIPFKKMVKSVQDDPFIPIAWQKDHSGMQGTEYFTDDYEIGLCRGAWVDASNQAVRSANHMANLGITKQLCNRVLEPYLWHTVLVTSTSYENWFDLRAPKYMYHVGAAKHPSCTEKDFIEWKSMHRPWTPTEKAMKSTSGAEIHIQALAEAMWDEYQDNDPAILREEEWHLPFGDRLDKTAVEKFAWISHKDRNISPTMTDVQICTARCARVSYVTFDNEIDFEKDVNLHDMLLKNKHMSPFEHCARAMTKEEYGWSGNFKGWVQYRKLI